MSSIGSILNTARSAINANQAAVRTASQNIANAQTDGYSRKRVDLVQAPVERTPFGWLGTGVMVDGVTRSRDEILDGVFRREAGRAAGYEMRQALVGQIEEVFGEPSDHGLAAVLDQFWGAWADLANQPGSDGARRVVRHRGEQLAGTLRDLSDRLDEQAMAGRTRLEEMTAEVNSLANQIANLNQTIQTARVGGGDAADLLDQRDLLLDRLASLGSVRVIERENGTLAVLFHNAGLVDGTVVRPLQASGSPPALSIGGDVLQFETPSAIGEVVSLLGGDIPSAKARLDELAAGVIARVNQIHRAGFTTDGATGIDFFDPDPAAATARGMRLSAAVAADHTRVVASSQPASASDNLIALQMAELRTDVGTMSGGTASFAGFYRDLVIGVAGRVHDAAGSASVYRNLAARVDARRQGISGVSTDEELVRLTQHQQAYMAAAKVVTAVDEMLQSILNMT